MNILPPRIPTSPLVASAPILGAFIAGVVIAKIWNAVLTTDGNSR